MGRQEGRFRYEGEKSPVLKVNGAAECGLEVERVGEV